MRKMIYFAGLSRPRGWEEQASMLRYKVQHGARLRYKLLLAGLEQRRPAGTSVLGPGAKPERGVLIPSARGAPARSVLHGYADSIRPSTRNQLTLL
jgi:hypothetical protein